MKILLVQDWLRSGGTERQSVFLSNAFAAAAHETTLLTFRPGGPLAATVAATVRRHALQSVDLRLDWFAPGLARCIEHAAPDVVLCMGRMANCHASAVTRRLAARSPHTAVVCTMRTGKALPWLFRRSLRECDHVVANSRDAHDFLVRRHHLPAEKISVIYNSLIFPEATSVDCGIPNAGAREQLRAKFSASPKTLVGLSVAMFRPEKQQRELIEIAAGLPRDLDWQLWLAGSGPTRAACERLAKSRGLAAQVRFIGFQPDPSSLYAAGDLAVHASSSESLSNFLIEAQAHGLPAVAYAAQGIRECFVPDRTGWAISRPDRAAFRRQFITLANEPVSTRQARSAEAREFARRTFDPQRQVGTYLELFARLVA